MKKLLFLLPLLALSSISVTACNTNKKARISYGTLVDTEAEEITYGILATKVARKENLLLAVHEGTSCGCWTEFNAVINKYVQEYKTKIYYIDKNQFSDGDDWFGLTIVKGVSDPTFALIKNGKKTNEYIYGNDNKKMFQDVEVLRKVVTKIARDPQYFMVSPEYLDNALFTEKKDKVLVQYIWNFCPDCNDCIPNVLMPYSEKHVYKNQVWLVDLAVKGILKDDEGNPNTSLQTYVDYMKNHKLSAAGDEKLGYDRGFVPTTQYWEKGELIDASTYFNDGISKVDGQYKITRSFYSESRMSNIHYSAEVVEGRTLSSEEVSVSVKDGVESYSWKEDYARAVHKPLLENFLAKYAL